MTFKILLPVEFHFLYKLISLTFQQSTFWDHMFVVMRKLVVVLLIVLHALHEYNHRKESFNHQQGS